MVSLIILVDTGGKIPSGLFFFLDPDPHLASVCEISITLSFEIRVVCVCVHVSTSLKSPPIMGNLRCD